MEDFYNRPKATITGTSLLEEKTGWTHPARLSPSSNQTIHGHVNPFFVSFANFFPIVLRYPFHRQLDRNLWSYRLLLQKWTR
ncbi:Uncharacterized protein APZ42_019672 [Daphnia magna]|uniref:Uncharacterized protein n=1 Tax=Daphnia magna TaxID=35525 RepID=A0A164YC49_9CRUS|nr:Uncharacterized protein APZ42_019672 [Daphnia magna]